MDLEKLTVVGRMTDKLNKIAGTSLPTTEIYCSEGLYEHMLKRKHLSCIKYIEHIPAIIREPDYVGSNPKEPESIELVKKFNNNVLLAIKLDKKMNYLYVASLYEIAQSKIDRRLFSNRLKRWGDEIKEKKGKKHKNGTVKKKGKKHKDGAVKKKGKKHKDGTVKKKGGKRHN